MTKLNIGHIPLVDLKGQYLGIKQEIDEAIAAVIHSTAFIKGKFVKKFEEDFQDYMDVKHVIACGNGTDALQVALMALELEKGDEIIVPAFSYAATIEVIALLGLVPVFVDVDYDSYNLNEDLIEAAISSKSRVIMPVHLFGQQCNMQKIKEIAESYNLYVIEDNAQSIGSKNAISSSASPIGDIACTSFFPSKNLGAYGDGGAIYTQSESLARKIRMICNHGQTKKYYHEIIGVNSRLDGMQAAILSVKLKHLDDFVIERKKAAKYYDSALAKIKGLKIPKRSNYSDHVFHQYTLKIDAGKRSNFVDYLKALKIASSIYYPLALHQQKAYEHFWDGTPLVISESLAKSVISIPIHSEMTEEIQEFVASNIKYFFNK